MQQKELDRPPKSYPITTTRSLPLEPLQMGSPIHDFYKLCGDRESTVSSTVHPVPYPVPASCCWGHLFLRGGQSASHANSWASEVMVRHLAESDYLLTERKSGMGWHGMAQNAFFCCEVPSIMTISPSGRISICPLNATPCPSA